MLTASPHKSPQRKDTLDDASDILDSPYKASKKSRNPTVKVGLTFEKQQPRPDFVKSYTFDGTDRIATSSHDYNNKVISNIKHVPAYRFGN